MALKVIISAITDISNDSNRQLHRAAGILVRCPESRIVLLNAMRIPYAMLFIMNLLFLDQGVALCTMICHLRRKKDIHNITGKRRRISNANVNVIEDQNTIL